VTLNRATQALREVGRFSNPIAALVAFLQTSQPNERTCKQDDDGAILILALVFILLIALSVLGLLTFGGTGIKDAASLQGQRSVEYAADGATTAAIQTVRYSYEAYDGNTNPAGDCLPTGSTIMIPEDGVNYTLTVDCSGTLEAAPTPQQYTREVSFYACMQSSCSESNAIVAATVDFQDLSSVTGVDGCDSSDTSTCGTGMVISDWIVKNIDT
jgi:hypothetical protein